MTANIADRFEQIVDTHPTRVAIDDGARRSSYAELDTRVNRCAHWLAGHGVGPADRVGIAVHNRVEHIEVLLAAFKIRAIPVNVNCAYTTEELKGLLTDANPRLVVHEPSIASALAAAGDWMCVSVGADYETGLATRSTARDFAPRSSTDSYVLYTGGTTGTPKGVRWHHEDLIDAVLAPDASEVPPARVLPACPLTHGTAQWTVLSALLHGSTIVLGDPQGLHPTAVWDRVEDAKVTRLTIVGDACARPLLDMLAGNPGRWDLSSLVAITSGGARWAAATQADLLDHLPHVAMVNTFGASETGGQGTQVTFAGQSPETARGLLRFISDGTTTVLDTNGQPVVPGSGVVGRLARSGPIPRSYDNDPGRTAAVFPEINGVRYAIPGDLATVEADGSIVVLGRDRNVINSGGEKVFAEEVESRLVGHPRVAEAVVAGLPDERWGEAIHALVKLHGTESVTEAELTDHCATALARFKLPRTITVTDTIRHLSTGKLDRAWAADTMSRNRREERPQ